MTMAIEYSLSIKQQSGNSDMLASPMKESSIENKGFTDAFEVTPKSGFQLDTHSKFNRFFEFEESGVLKEFEWEVSREVSFRFLKDFDNVLAKRNMIKIVSYALKNTKADAILLFNGELLVLCRKNGHLILNNDFGFWDQIKDLYHSLSSEEI